MFARHCPLVIQQYSTEKTVPAFNKLTLRWERKYVITSIKNLILVDNMYHEENKSCSMAYSACLEGGG